MELGFVDWLRETLPPPPEGVLGVGDDAAALAVASGRLVATSDLLIDGVHFRTEEHSPERIGRKALAVNLSDLAAMAAKPLGALVSLALPRDHADREELARGLVRGMLPLATELGCPIVGGDTNVGPGPLVVSVTAFGEPTAWGLVGRDGARPGDWLMVTSFALGGSLLGEHLDFMPRVREALTLVRRADLHAMLDLSDGLSLDLRRMCDASGVGAVVYEDYLPVSDAAKKLAGESGKSAVERALSDGEDFELLLAVSEETGRDLLRRPPLACGLQWIGGVVEHREGVTLRRNDGSCVPLTAGGYEHR